MVTAYRTPCLLHLTIIAYCYTHPIRHVLYITAMFCFRIIAVTNLEHAQTSLRMRRPIAA